MRNLEDFLQQTTSYHDTLIQKIFKSKKHTVALVLHHGKPRVLKWFHPAYIHNMNREYETLSTYSSTVTIPSVFEKDDKHHVLILQYITGENLCDLINSSQVSQEEKTRLIILLAQWYVHFHDTLRDEDSQYIHGDAHLRNFHFSDRIWGFDFEELRTGEPVQDIAGLAASILTTDPSFTKEKLQLTQTFISSYKDFAGTVLPSLDDELNIALSETQERRLQYLSKNSAH